MKLNRITMVLSCIILFIGTGFIPGIADEDEMTSETILIIVPDNYQTIQQAIDNASYGDTIFVKMGIYHENIVIDKSESNPEKSLNLVGENRNTTIIEGYRNDAVIRILSDNINILEFTIRNGTPNGLYAGNGIHLDADYCNISHNIITENDKQGLFIHGNHNLIIENTISHNIKCGIYLYNSDQNLIYHNNFIGNREYNAWDIYGVNDWYDPVSLEGNYWDDYQGIDVDGDGIGDTSYEIPPSQSENQDDYPFMKPNGWYWYPPPLVPDLTCVGTLSWVDEQPGTNSSGTISILNVGDPGSLLNWNITSYPDWGHWTIVPISGENLRPEDGSKTVAIIVEIPDEENAQFSGEILVTNRDNISDSYAIPVFLTTPKNKAIYFPFLDFFENHPYLFQLLQRLLVLL
jgi:parallel beta-helix repeat protein